MKKNKQGLPPADGKQSLSMNKLLIGIGTIFVVVVLSLNNKANNLVNTPKAQTAVTLPVNTATPASLVGKVAPDFTLTDIDGQTFHLAAVKGNPIIVYGMAGWCGECIPEGQALTKIQADYVSKGVKVIGVAFTKGDNKTLLEQYRQVGKITIPLAIDTDSVTQKYQLTNLEMTYIISKDGTVVYKGDQSMSYDDLKKQLDKII